MDATEFTVGLPSVKHCLFLTWINFTKSNDVILLPISRINFKFPWTCWRFEKWGFHCIREITQTTAAEQNRVREELSADFAQVTNRSKKLTLVLDMVKVSSCLLNDLFYNFR